MFVLPALFALACDSLVIYIGRRPLAEEEERGIEAEGDGYFVASSSQLVFLSTVRLLLLCGPLSYYTHTGTRIRFQSWYYLFHVVSLVVVIGQSLSIITHDSHSLKNFLRDSPFASYMESVLGDFIQEEIGENRRILSSDDLNGGEEFYEGALGIRRHLEGISNSTSSDHMTDVDAEVSHTVRRMCILLSASFTSIIFHFIMLTHARSTAPSSQALLKDHKRGNRRKMLAYYAYRRAYGDRASLTDAHPFVKESNGLQIIDDAPPWQSTGRSSGRNYDSIPMNDNESAASKEDGDKERVDGVAIPTLSRGGGGPVIIRFPPDLPRPQRISRGNSFGNRYDVFMTDVQVRLEYARQQWAARLNDVQSSIRGGINGDDGILTSPGVPSQPVSPISNSIPFLQLSPFRALLQLYAYQEVFANNKLEKAFADDDHYSSEVLAFYSPQILSFLLHGAFLNSAVLEAWVLDKCRKNVHFAHRCFWFLRAWCLGQGSHVHGDESGVGLEGTETSDEEVGRSLMIRRNGSEVNLYLENHPDKNAHDNANSLERRNSSKFPEEERNAIQELLFKVIKCGQEAAVALNVAAPFAVDESANASCDHFLATPTFLDALTSIADDLMLEEKADRTKVLREKLRALEAELLPCNTVYIPLGDANHRVCRIAADESIALSTNERVPCIVCLEVLEFEVAGAWQPDRAASSDSDEPSSPIPRARAAARKLLHGTMSSERDILDVWYKEDRPPMRHNTLLDKFSNYTRQLRDDIGETVIWAASETDVEMPYPVNGTVMADYDVGAIGEVMPPKINSSKLTRTAAAKLSSSQTSSLGSTRPPSPSQAMGQWHSPGRAKKGTVGETLSEASIRLKAQGSDLVLSEILSMPSLDESEPSLDAPRYGPAPRAPKRDERKTRVKRNRPPPVVFKEDWQTKSNRVRTQSPYGSNSNFRLLPCFIKSNDDLRQEQLASQLIYRMACILSKAKAQVWLYPYEIIALSDRGGIIEAVPDTISIDSLKKNDPDYIDLKTFFDTHFGPPGSEAFAGAKASFVESLAGYSIVCYLLNIKDRHNGNILLTSKGHLVHIDFGFFFLSSPGKNSGFESAPFKLTKEFSDLLDGPGSHTFDKFRQLCHRAFLELRAHCHEIILLVEMLTEGNEDLACFASRPEQAVEELRARFRLDLSDRACWEYVNSLIDESCGNWRTAAYDHYQRCFVGVM